MLQATKSGLDYYRQKLRSIPVRSVPHHRVPALPPVRPVFPQHRSVFRRHGLHRPHEKTGRHRLHLLRHRSRTRPSVVGTPAHRRAGSRLQHDVRNARRVFRAESNGEKIRRRQHSQISETRTRHLSPRPGRRDPQGTASRSGPARTVCLVSKRWAGDVHARRLHRRR